MSRNITRDLNYLAVSSTKQYEIILLKTFPVYVAYPRK